MPEFLTQSIWTERIGWVLVHSLWQFALVALFTFTFHQTLPRCSANTRYRVLLAAMFVLIAAPVVTFFSPWSAETPRVAIALDSAGTRENVAGAEDHKDAMSMAVLSAAPSAKHAAARQAEPTDSKPAAVGLILLRSKAKQFIQPRLFGIVLLWLGGVLLVALRPLLSWHTVYRLRTVNVCSASKSVQEMRNRIAKRLGLLRAVDVLQSTLAKTPMVVGCFRPVVLLPLSMVMGLPAAQLELILAHELAHIHRHDYLINMLQTLAETIFFYHPAVWWLSRQIRNEREHCCDDMAMAGHGSRADYGRALLAIEEMRATSPALSLAAHGGSLARRIRRIAGFEPVPRVAGSGSVLCVILLSVAIYLTAMPDAASSGEKPEGAKVASPIQDAAKASDTILLPSLDRGAPKEVWSLGLKDAIRFALQNSKVMRSIGVQMISLPKSSTPGAGAASGGDKAAETMVGNDERLLIARTNTDIAQVDFEAGVRNMVSDVELAYWELYFHYRNLDAVVASRNGALATWQKIDALHRKGERGGDAATEAQAREQYYLFRNTAEQALSSLNQSETKLRYLMGIAPTDGRMMRPSEEPNMSKTTFAWPEIQAEALRRNIEIRRQRWQVKQRESALTAAKDYATSNGDRRDVGLRNAKLALTKEHVKLQEAELELSHALATAFRNLEADYVLAETDFNRRAAAESNLNAVKTAYEAGTIQLDVLHQAQRLRAQAESDYYRAAVNYHKSIAMVHYRKGSLLEYGGVYLAEKPN